jgi:hypothetical protein
LDFGESIQLARQLAERVEPGNGSVAQEILRTFDACLQAEFPPSYVGAPGGHLYIALRGFLEKSLQLVP